jgi:hypothetical protein
MRRVTPTSRISSSTAAENLKCRLDEFQRQRVYGRDKLEQSTGLDGHQAHPGPRAPPVRRH